MSAPNPLAVPPDPQADTCAETAVTVTGSPPARSHRGRASCGSCGQAWFGEVAYCPYCGHASTDVPVDRDATALPAPDGHAVDQARSASEAAVPSPLEQKPGSVTTAMRAVTTYVHDHAGQLRLSGAPAGSRAGEPGSSWKSGWKPTVAVIALLAVIAFTVDRLSDTGRHPTPEPMSTPATTPAAVAPPQGPIHGGPATGAQAPATEPPAPRADRDSRPQPSAPAPQRSLCSAASAAAGLCNPQ